MTNARADFLEALVRWLNGRFELDEPVGPDTALFDGLIDSMRILELIAWTEVATSRTIPDTEIVMSNFATARTIARVFHHD